MIAFTSHHTTSLLVASLFLVVIATFIHGVQGQTITSDDYTRLVNDTIHAYSNRLRPVTNQGEALNVTLTFNLMNLLGINEVQQEFRLNAWFNVSWYDEIRTWNASDYGGVDVIYPQPEDIWLPRIVVTNSLAKRDLFADDYYPLAIFSSGATRWFPGTIFHLTCDLDLTYFPFDTQHCKITLLAMNYARSVFLNFSEEGVVDAEYTEHGEWQFISYTTSQGSKYVSADNEGFRQLTVVFTFKRQSFYYKIVIVYPVIFLSLLSCFAFLIPEGGNSIGFSVTVLLSLTVYMTIISYEIPPVSNNLPIFLFCTFIFMYLGLLCTIVNVIFLHYIGVRKNLHKNKNSDPTSMDKPNHENCQAVAPVMSQTSSGDVSEKDSIRLVRLRDGKRLHDNEQNHPATVTVDNESVDPEIDHEKDIHVNLMDEDVRRCIPLTLRSRIRSIVETVKKSIVFEIYTSDRPRYIIFGSSILIWFLIAVPFLSIF